MLTQGRVEPGDFERLSRAGKIAGIALLILSAVFLLAFLEVFQAPENTLIWESALDAGHVPLFGLMSLIFLVLIRSLTSRRAMTAYFLAFVMAFFLAAVIEGIQYFGPRDADPRDLARGTAGILSFLGLAMTLDRRLEIRAARRLALVAGAVVLIAVSLASFALLIRAYRYRASSFPSICTFDESWERSFYGVARAELSVTRLPPPWSDGSGNEVGRITFLKATYTGFHISEVYPDWRGYRRLCFDTYSELEEPVELILRIHDAHHDNSVGDRFNRSLVIDPGRNEIRIGLDEIRKGPSSRELDLSQVWGLALFAVGPDSVFSLYVDAFRLEGD